MNNYKRFEDYTSREQTLIILKGYKITYGHNMEAWALNGLYHREDGPAIIWDNGEVCWKRRGVIHREDGPAIIHRDGAETWYFDNQVHREDGPAVTTSDKIEKYFIHGRQYSKEDHKLLMKLKAEEATCLF